MKKYFITTSACYDKDDKYVIGELFVGDSWELMPVWKSIFRHRFGHNLDYLYAERPKLRDGAMYGLEILYWDTYNEEDIARVSSVNSDTIVRYFANGDLEDASADMFGIYEV